MTDPTDPRRAARYELVDHTADLAVRVRGRDLGELCRNLAYTVCDLLADAASVDDVVAVPLALDAPDREALVVTLANEVIYRRDAEGLLLPRLELSEISATSLRGTVRGEAADPERHALRAGLKAATWHELQIREIAGGLELFLVFDV
jgi:protein archease